MGDGRSQPCLECSLPTEGDAVLQSPTRPWLVLHRTCAEFDLRALDERVLVVRTAESLAEASELLAQLRDERRSLEELFAELDRRLPDLEAIVRNALVRGNGDA
jgi:hypothetical protein